MSISMHVIFIFFWITFLIYIQGNRFTGLKVWAFSWLLVMIADSWLFSGTIPHPSALSDMWWAHWIGCNFSNNGFHYFAFTALYPKLSKYKIAHFFAWTISYMVGKYIFFLVDYQTWTWKSHFNQSSYGHTMNQKLDMALPLLNIHLPWKCKCCVWVNSGELGLLFSF